MELQKPYRDEIDLAFFVVEIGMSVNEYRMLTEVEKKFIRKAHGNKFIKDTTWARNASLNAYANANRKKRQRFIELFPKKTRIDKEYNENAMKVIEKIKKRDGKTWAEKVYKANKIDWKGGN